MIKDFFLNSGERQVSPCVEGIRYDHVVRYEMCIKILKGTIPYLNILDIFCGNGYGTYLLAKEFKKSSVTGIDGSQEAIDLANKHYSLQNNLFIQKLFPFLLPISAYDAVISLESIEHIENDFDFVSQLGYSIKSGGLLLLSVPNQQIHDLNINPHKFHYRHYLKQDIIRLIGHEFDLISYYGQEVYLFDENKKNTFKLLSDEQMQLKENVEGQVNIFVFKKHKTTWPFFRKGKFRCF